MSEAVFDRIRNSQSGCLQGLIFLGNLFVRSIRHFLIQRRALDTIGARPWDMQPFRTSETLFVLGSGASIASYSERQFSQIRINNSIGFNFWLLHEHVPTYYVAEFMSGSQRSDTLWRNLQRRANDYANTPVIMKYSRACWEQRKNIPEVFTKLFVASHLSVPGNDGLSFARWLRFLDRFGLLTGSLPSGLILFRQASLSWLLVFAMQQGYRTIVLCGVDLNSPYYFYDLNQRYSREKGLEIPPAEFAAPIHPTNDARRCTGGLTISEVLRIMDDVLLKSRGIKLYIGSLDSALHPQFPLYPWNQHEN